MFRIHSMSSPQRSLLALRRRLTGFERLEARELLALTVLEETFKTVRVSVTGEYSGSSSSVVSGELYTDQYTGTVTSGTGEIHYTSPTNGSGTMTLAGNATGQEHHGALSSNYAITFNGSMNILDTGGAVATAHLESFITRDGTLSNIRGGGTPLDLVNAGALSVATVPYTLTTGRSINSPQPFSMNAGQFTGHLIPMGSLTNPAPYDLSVTATFHNGFYDAFVNAAGPAQTAVNRATPVGQVSVYFATGPNVGDIVTDIAPLATQPIYWNSASAMLRVQPTATVAPEWTHLIFVADHEQVLAEANEANNVWSLPIVKPKSLAIYDFTATVQSMVPDRFGELPTIANGTQISGRFQYDQTTGQIGQVELAVPGLPHRPSERFFRDVHSSVQGGAIDRASVNYSTNIAGWQNNQVDTRFEFQGNFPNGFPASLLGLPGEVTISSPSVANGFVVTATINALTPVTNYAPFQNPAGRFFVNVGDMTTAAQDFALIVNRFNVTGPGPLDPPLGPIDEYWDVDGNNFLSLTDAAIIRAIVNANEQGEAPTTLTAAIPESLSEPMTVATAPLTANVEWLPEMALAPVVTLSSEPQTTTPTLLVAPLPFEVAAQLWAWRYWQLEEQRDTASSITAEPEERAALEELFASEEPFWQTALA